MRPARLEPAHLERADVVLAMTREPARHHGPHPPAGRAPAVDAARAWPGCSARSRRRRRPSTCRPPSGCGPRSSLSVVSRRHFAPPFHDDDVADPYGRDDGAHKAAWRHVDQALQVLLRAALGDVKSPSHRTS
ncbi:hypothetical protein GCM10025868_14550 [Angustibacter aerolatus]|uniref:Phosphotyrosine protein phosphatase I domain-containing protein n=1 Tax=Angustibacter aerolatus TaxID=1162965 RepID=A0ABQ6JDE5_9ACTN|nr:hypothetical protein GCM10025868_14550 [Angustibacter aerolatus]